MSPAPFIIKAGASAAKAASGAAAGAAKIAASDKAAKALGGAFKSIEETTKMGGFQSLENWSENNKNSKPVIDSFQVLGALFSAETMGSRTALMESLISLFTSDGFGMIIRAVAELTNVLVNSASTIISVLDKALEAINSVESDVPVGLEQGGGGKPYWIQDWYGNRYDINAQISEAIYQAAVEAGGQLPQF